MKRVTFRDVWAFIRWELALWICPELAELRPDHRRMNLMAHELATALIGCAVTGALSLPASTATATPSPITPEAGK